MIIGHGLSFAVILSDDQLIVVGGRIDGRGNKTDKVEIEAEICNVKHTRFYTLFILLSLIFICDCNNSYLQK